MNEYCINALYSGFQGDTLAHHGILGMHWGIRRFQPYGQGYDADHEGREVGLAARLGGSGGSFSSTYGRGRSKGSIVERAKSAASKFGKKAYDVSQEAAERLNYGLSRAEKKAREAASRARAKLENYASQRLDDDLYYRRDTALQDRLKRSGLGSLLGEAAKTVGHNVRKGATYASPVLKDAMQKFRNEPETREKVKSFMQDKARGVMERTKVASQEFSRNARATASLLAGAFDPRSSASQIVEGRANRAASRIAGGKIGPDMTRLSDMRVKKPGYQPLSETIFGKNGNPYRGEFSPWDLSKAGYKDLADKLYDRRTAYDKQVDRDRNAKKNSVSSLMGWRGDLGQRSDAIKRSVDRGQFRTTDSSRERQLKELGDMMRAYADPNKQTSPYRFALSAREGLQRLDEVITPAVRGTKVDSERFKNLSSMEKRLLGL